jgi:hypothetical protein
LTNISEKVNINLLNRDTWGKGIKRDWILGSHSLRMKVKFEILCQFPSFLLCLFGVYVLGLCTKGFWLSRPVVPDLEKVFRVVLAKGAELARTR